MPCSSVQHGTPQQLRRYAIRSSTCDPGPKKGTAWCKITVISIPSAHPDVSVPHRRPHTSRFRSRSDHWQARKQYQASADEIWCSDERRRSRRNCASHWRFSSRVACAKASGSPVCKLAIFRSAFLDAPNSNRRDSRLVKAQSY